MMSHQRQSETGFERSDGQAAAEVSLSPEAADEAHFTDRGAIPPVTTGSAARTQPTASERGYGVSTPAPATEVESGKPEQRGVPVVVEVDGVKIVANAKSAAAVAPCEAFVRQLVDKNLYAQKKLKKIRVTIVVIPSDEKMTDLPQFADIKGKRTFDGRLWDDVRGSGGTRAPDGSWVIGVAEETLLHLDKDAYPAGYSIGMHEFAHTLQGRGFTAAQQTKLDELYAARNAANGPWTEAYGSSNMREYFAQITNSYFGENTGVGNNGRDWLEKNDPGACAFLDELYGSRFDEQGKRETD